MRLFLAIDFDRRTKEALDGVVLELRRVTDSGTFTRRENHHLTLAFLGETGEERVPLIRAVMADCVCPPFSLTTGGPGRFDRREGDLYWVGLEKSLQLHALQAGLEWGLRAAGFNLERRAFRPHLTLARRVRHGPEFSWDRFAAALPVLEIPVGEITLMESLRPEGEPVYRPVDGVKLIGGNDSVGRD